MAGTVVNAERNFGSMRKLSFAWTSSAGGAADAVSVEVFDGEIIGFTTIPDAVDAPTDNYDVRVLDWQGHDVLLGAGANRDTANTEHVARANLAGVASSTLTLEVTNAGNAKKGVVILYIR